MSHNARFVRVLTFIAAVAAPAIAVAAPDQTDCLLSKQRITSVVPYRTGEHIGKAAVQQLRGARIFVEATPGVTAEWLQLELRRHLGAMKATNMVDCVFDIDGVGVDVATGGSGFWVTLRASTPQDAREVLRRAQLLLG